MIDECGTALFIRQAKHDDGEPVSECRQLFHPVRYPRVQKIGNGDSAILDSHLPQCGKRIVITQLLAFKNLQPPGCGDIHFIAPGYAQIHSDR